MVFNPTDCAQQEGMDGRLRAEADHPAHIRAQRLTVAFRGRPGSVDGPAGWG